MPSNLELKYCIFPTRTVFPIKEIGEYKLGPAVEILGLALIGTPFNLIFVILGFCLCNYYWAIWSIFMCKIPDN